MEVVAPDDDLLLQPRRRSARAGSAQPGVVAPCRSPFRLDCCAYRFESPFPCRCRNNADKPTMKLHYPSGRLTPVSDQVRSAACVSDAS
eukprot:11035523-Lingulodinium_polyedra.AAC.1